MNIKFDFRAPLLDQHRQINHKNIPFLLSRFMLLKRVLTFKED